MRRAAERALRRSDDVRHVDEQIDERDVIMLPRTVGRAAAQHVATSRRVFGAIMKPMPTESRFWCTPSIESISSSSQRNGIHHCPAGAYETRS